MENKIDQFFKDKLEGNTLLPSEEAWAKVEANLSKKNNIAVWRIAATILIAGALITVMIWSQRSADQQQPAIATNHLPKDNSVKEKRMAQSSSKEKKEAVKSAKELPVTSHAQQISPNSNQNNKPVTTTEKKKLVATGESIAEVEKDNPSEALAKEGVLEENIKPEATPRITIASTHQKSIKLEFTLEDFSSAPPEATVEAKSSGLKKVWELAREVKNGDGPVREIKNELLALNFKKNKNQ
jgi:hypothetical protein